MWDHDIGAVPVTDSDGKLVGIVTDRDVLMGAYFAGMDLGHFPVSDAMSHRLFAVGPEEPLVAAEQVMRSHQVRRVPVLQEGRLVGMISLGDLARAEAASVGTATSMDAFAAIVRDIVRPRMHIGTLAHVAQQ